MSSTAVANALQKCGGVRIRSALLSLIGIIAGTQAIASSFIVPDDRSFASQTGVIVIASPLASRTERTGDDFLQTITTLSIERVIKGSIEQTIDLYEPGGMDDKLSVDI